MLYDRTHGRFSFAGACRSIAANRVPPRWSMLLRLLGDWYDVREGTSDGGSAATLRGTIGEHAKPACPTNRVRVPSAFLVKHGELQKSEGRDRDFAPPRFARVRVAPTRVLRQPPAFDG